MTEAILQKLVDQLFNTIKDPVNVLLAVMSQLDQMAEELAPMKSFLIDASKLVEHKDKETVKQSLGTLRNLIYDADDILSEYQVRTDYWNHAPNMRCTRFHPQELIFRYRTGNKLTDINMKIHKMKENLNTYWDKILIRKDEESSRDTTWRSPIYDQSELVGLSKDTDLIKGWILPKNKELQQVGIVGMGGLGKTTLTRNIFNDVEVKDHFKEMIWVSVSQTFNRKEIMESMLKQLNQDGGSCTSDQEMFEKIQEALKHKTYLIVMDDVWDTENGFDWWVNISGALPKEEKCSSSIIITTRNEEVAKSMGVVEGKIHRPNTLDQNDSWSLFCKIAFKSPKGECDVPDLVPVGKEILGRCGGLPLAIKTIGGLLSTKQKNVSDWEKIRDEFHVKLTDNGNRKSILTSLQLSYDELPPELKLCILCFSIYPEDYIISTEQLVLWWVGEGFVGGKDQKPAIQVAADYISELFSRCLIEVVNHKGYDGRIFNCKMHDMVRDLIIKMAKEEAFCSFGDGCMQQFNSESRHLGLASAIETQSPPPKSNLRALLLTKRCSFSFSLFSGLANVNSLRVLDLSKTKLEGVCIGELLRWIKSQRCLSYLNLRGVAGLKEVPKWIRKLRNLQILILADCNDLELLHPDITTLPKLTVLDIWNCPSLRNLPQGLGNLSNLEELSGFKLASRGEVIGCRLSDLGTLTKLRVLRIFFREETDIRDDELKVLSGLQKLHVLSIDTNDSKNEEILKKVDQLVPPKCLKELYLRRYSRDVKPEWLTPSKLTSLQYLCIENAGFKSIKPRVSDNEEQHWNIRGMCLKYLPILNEEWKTVQEIMPKLEYLEVSSCFELQNFPLNVQKFGVWRKKDDNAKIKEEKSKITEETS